MKNWDCFSQVMVLVAAIKPGNFGQRKQHSRDPQWSGTFLMRGGGAVLSDVLRSGNCGWDRGRKLQQEVLAGGENTGCQTHGS
jgi:hypothetical protein